MPALLQLHPVAAPTCQEPLSQPAPQPRAARAPSGLHTDLLLKTELTPSPKLTPCANSPLCFTLAGWTVYGLATLLILTVTAIVAKILLHITFR